MGKDAQNLHLKWHIERPSNEPSNNHVDGLIWLQILVEYQCNDPRKPTEANCDDSKCRALGNGLAVDDFQS